MRQDVESAVRKVADEHGIEQAALLAVVDIESAGNPFEIDGTTPEFLFERHIFYQQLRAIAPDKLQAAVDQGLAHPDWRPQSQYRDEGTSAMKLALFQKACAVHEEAAYRSCSWGVGQTMGFQYAKLGFDSAKAMVDKMRGSVEEQVECMVGEITASNLLVPLQRHLWTQFARGYNGAGYATNRYDSKLAYAYTVWRNRKPSVPAEPDTPPDPNYIARPGNTEFDPRLAQVQSKLRKLGYPVGNVDGFNGKITSAAIATFQDTYALEGDRGCWYAAYDSVLENAQPFVSEDRASITTGQMQRRDPITRKLGWYERVLAFVGLGGAFTQSLPDTANQIAGSVGAFSGLAQAVAGHKVLIITVGAFLAALCVRWVILDLTGAYRRFDYQGTDVSVSNGGK
jgi:peptidoglycan hydrolase-like protein with peptidoglycan-binding domain